MNKNIIFNASEFLPSLTLANSVVLSKNAMPILNDVRIETKEGENGSYAMLTTSDSEMWLQIKTPVDAFTESGICICIESKALLQALRTLGNQQITMEICEEKQLVVCKYANGHFQLPYTNADMFPLPTNIEKEQSTEILLDGKKMLMGIERAGYATANDELRPVMNGVRVEFFNDGMVFVASDGLKLAKYKDLTIVRESENEENVGITLPKRPCGVLMNVLANITEGDVKVAFNDRSFVVNNKQFKITARLIEGRYPNYNSVIPQDNNIEVTMDKNALVSALKRVAPMGNANSELIVLNFKNGKLTISADDVDYNKSASESISCNYASQEDFTIGFKGSVLLQLLQNIGTDNVKFLLKEPNRPCVIREAEPNSMYDYTSLCMPMLINN